MQISICLNFSGILFLTEELSSLHCAGNNDLMHQSMFSRSFKANSLSFIHPSFEIFIIQTSTSAQYNASELNSG